MNGEVQETKKVWKSHRPLYWIPMIWNGLTLLVALVVGMTFLWGSQQAVDAQVDLPGIILFFFTVFDLLLIISPLTLVVMIMISIFNVMRESDKMHRFLPLTLSAIVQGALTALFLTSITQPAA